MTTLPDAAFALTERTLGVSSAESVGLTDGRSGRQIAVWFPRHCSSLSEIWIRSADGLEKIGLTTTGTRAAPELTKVFLTILKARHQVAISLP